MLLVPARNASALSRAHQHFGRLELSRWRSARLKRRCAGDLRIAHEMRDAAVRLAVTLQAPFDAVERLLSPNFR